MLVLGVLTAEPLCKAGWDAVVSGEHLERGIVAIAAGLICGVTAGSFHWWKDRISERGRTWIRSNATWWVPVAFVLFFIYAVGPDIYRRATLPPTPVPVAISTSVPATSPAGMGTSQPDQRDAIIADLRTQLGTTKQDLDSTRRALQAIRQQIAAPVVPRHIGVACAVNLVNSFGSFGTADAMKQMPRSFVVITGSPGNENLERDLNTVFNNAAAGNAGALSLMSPPNYVRDPDAPKLNGPGAPGLTIHGRSAAGNLLMQVLSNYFVTHQTAEVPQDELLEYYRRKYPSIPVNTPVVWVEIGAGSPWKDAFSCGE